MRQHDLEPKKLVKKKVWVIRNPKAPEDVAIYSEDRAHDLSVEGWTLIGIVEGEFEE